MLSKNNFKLPNFITEQFYSFPLSVKSNSVHFKVSFQISFGFYHYFAY